MPQLTDRQRKLLRLVNRLSQNLSTDNSGIDIDLPGLGIDIDLGDSGSSNTPPSDTPTTPTSMREVMSTLVNEQVEVTTPFGTVTGTLLAVNDDYIVLVEDGNQVLVRIEKIELVSDL